MTEYTLLEDNPEIQGNGRDLTMDPALYMARVIHTDLTVANANAWHWWLGVSPYDYKDGLVYIDLNKSDGDVYESKMLWALGNYSRFVLPGMKRVEVRRSDNRSIEQTLNGVMVSAFKDPATQKTVAVAVNYGEASIPVKIDIDDVFITCSIYQTSSQHSLKKLGETNFEVAVKLPPRSVTTFVEK
jgi:O-glycosyl hydrolase